MTVWYSLWAFGILFSVLICLDQEKSGNPGVREEGLTLECEVLVDGVQVRGREGGPVLAVGQREVVLGQIQRKLAIF
jgi:hypothetical protein